MNGSPDRPERNAPAKRAFSCVAVLSVIASLLAGAPPSEADLEACVTNTEISETLCELATSLPEPFGLLYRIDIPMNQQGDPVGGFTNGLGYGEINSGFLAGYLYAEDLDNSILASTLRMRMRIDDLIFTSSDPVAEPVEVRLNFLIDGTISLHETSDNEECLGGIQVTVRAQTPTDVSPVGVATGSYFSRDRLLDPYTATGIFQGLTGPTISGTYQTEPFSVPLNEYVSLEFDVLLTAEAEGAWDPWIAYSAETRVDFRDAIRFPDTAVFDNLPPGVTVNSLEGFITDNSWQLPLTTETAVSIISESTTASIVDLTGMRAVIEDFLVQDNGETWNTIHHVDARDLVRAGGNLVVSGNSTLYDLGLDSLQTVYGNLDVSSNTQLTEIFEGPISDSPGHPGSSTVQHLVVVEGSLNLSSNGSDKVVLDDLVKVGGPFTVTDNPDLITVSVRDLEKVDGSFTITGNPLLENIVIKGLHTVAGDLTLSNNPNLSGIDLYHPPLSPRFLVPYLRTVGGSLVVSDTKLQTMELQGLNTTGGLNLSGNQDLTTVSLPDLETNLTDLTMSNNPALDSVDLSSLQTVGGSFELTGNDELWSLSVPQLTSVTGNMTLVDNRWSFGAPALNPNLDVGGNFTAEIFDAGTITLRPTVHGDLTLTVEGGTELLTSIAEGDTFVVWSTAQSVIEVFVPAGSLPGAPDFDIQLPPSLGPEQGFDHDGTRVTIDPAIVYNSNLPRLLLGANLITTIDVRDLEASSRATFLNGLALNVATIAVKATPDSDYEALRVCGPGEQPSDDDCVLVTWLTAGGAPTSCIAQLAFVTFEYAAGSFSTHAVATVQLLDDQCDADPEKSRPGICGCDVPDYTDSDGDCLVDCLDGCPHDPAKSDPGVCGCGAPETDDSDGDGAPDCVDCAPDDPEVYPGAIEIPYTGKDEDCTAETRDFELCFGSYNLDPVPIEAPSIAVDSDGNLHMAFIAGVTNPATVGHLFYAKNVAGSWGQPELVDNEVSELGDLSVRGTSIAVDSSNRPHISYHDEYVSVLKYAIRNVSGVWTTESVHEGDSKGSIIALDSADRPHIVYEWFFSDANGVVVVNVINHVARSASPCAPACWPTPDYVASSGDAGQNTDQVIGFSAAMDSTDTWHVVYGYGFPSCAIEPPGVPQEIRYATDASGEWVSSPMAPRCESTGTPVEKTADHFALTVDAGNHLHLGYTMNHSDLYGGAELRYASNATGSWSFEEVSSFQASEEKPYQTEYSSVAIDVEGLDTVHVSYVDEYYAELVYATNQLGVWYDWVVDSAQEAEGNPAMIVDSAGWPHIVYYGGEPTAGLSYATVEPCCGADSWCNPACADDPDCPICGENDECNPDCIQDPDCCVADGWCNPACEVGEDPDCATCGEDGVCNPACAPGADPDCDCSENGECNPLCAPGTDPDCDCSLDEWCDPACEPGADPDCDCSENGECNPLCAPGTDPDCDCSLDEWCDPACEPGTDPDCDCSADEWCNPACEPGTDPDCDCSADEWCDPACEPGTDPDCDCSLDEWCDPACEPGTDPDCDCSLDEWCNPACEPGTDPDCDCSLDEWCDPACEPGTDPDCDCSSDEWCNPACEPGADPDCCHEDGWCNHTCEPGTDPDCDCSADEWCNPACEPGADPDCCHEDGWCNHTCEPGTDPDCDCSENGECNPLCAPGADPDCCPVVTVLNAPVEPVSEEDIVTVEVQFADANSEDTHSATVDWGDGDITQPTLGAGSRRFESAHNYDEPGVYVIRVAVSDGFCEGLLEYRYVVVYDPSAGFVTGGGWIESPPGAFRPDPTLTGHATFGFVSKYKKGANKPTGVTEFQFQVANLNFHSNEYDWLVISGPRAQYKGTGTINGAGEFGFMLTAIDADRPGGGEEDRFRMKIWEKGGDDLTIYDNQPYYDDQANLQTVVQQGSIVIHKGKK